MQQKSQFQEYTAMDFDDYRPERPLDDVLKQWGPTRADLAFSFLNRAEALSGGGMELAYWWDFCTEGLYRNPVDGLTNAERLRQERPRREPMAQVDRVDARPARKEAERRRQVEVADPPVQPGPRESSPSGKAQAAALRGEASSSRSSPSMFGMGDDDMENEVPEVEPQVAQKVEEEALHPKPSSRPKNLAKWSLRQVLLDAWPSWNMAQAKLMEERFRKVGVSSVPMLAEALARDLDQRLFDASLEQLGEELVAALRCRLWEPSEEARRTGGALEDYAAGRAEHVEDEDDEDSSDVWGGVWRRLAPAVWPASLFGGESCEFEGGQFELTRNRRQGQTQVHMRMDDEDDAEEEEDNVFDASEEQWLMMPKQEDIFDLPADQWLMEERQEKAETVVDESDQEVLACLARTSSLLWPLVTQLPSPKPVPAAWATQSHEDTGMDFHWLELARVPQLARMLGLAAGVSMACRVAALNRILSQWMLAAIPVLSQSLPADIYVLGGHALGERWTPSGAINRFIPSTQSWEFVSELPTPRTLCTSVASGGLIYVVGGFDGRRLLDLCECFDLTARTWKSLPPMSAPRYTCGAAAMRGVLYVIGGVGNQAKPHDAYECFDPATGLWAPFHSSSLGCSTSVAVATLGKHIYVVGFLHGRSEFERFDPKQGVWEKLPPLQPALLLKELSGAVAMGERLYVCSSCILSFRIFDTRRGRWEALPTTTGLPGKVGAGTPWGVASASSLLYILGRWDIDEQESSEVGAVSFQEEKKLPSRKRQPASWRVLPRFSLSAGGAVAATRC